MKSTINAICEAAKQPISIILVAVGEKDNVCKNFRFLDGDFDPESGERSKLIHSETGESCCRDIV